MPLGWHPETEALVKEEAKATIRCIPLEGDKTPGKCMVTGKPSAQRVLFARPIMLCALEIAGLYFWESVSM